jgi:hypothetical protein
MANLGFKRGTRIIGLLVAFRFRRSRESVPQGVANFGIGTLARCAGLRGGPMIALVAAALLVGSSAANAGEVAARGLMCRGGGGMTVEPDKSNTGSALIRLTRDIAPSLRSWLAPGECQWFESVRNWRAQRRYDALYYCCHTHLERLALLIDSGHPFRLWVYPDETFSTVLVIEAIGE